MTLTHLHPESATQRHPGGHTGQAILAYLWAFLGWPISDIKKGPSGRPFKRLREASLGWPSRQSFYFVYFDNGITLWISAHKHHTGCADIRSYDNGTGLIITVVIDIISNVESLHWLTPYKWYKIQWYKYMLLLKSAD